MTPLFAAAIPWHGPAAQVVVHDGHAPGHGAVFLPDTGVLVAGDMCSDVEIPLLDPGCLAEPLGDYRAGLQRLAAVPGVRWVVPATVTSATPPSSAAVRSRLALPGPAGTRAAVHRPAADPAGRRGLTNTRPSRI